MILALLARVLVVAFPCGAIAQVAFLQIRVVEGEGAVHVAGARASGPLIIEVTDEGGRPVTGASVSFHLPEAGPSGFFANRLRTIAVLTDAAGRAAARGLELNHEPGAFQIRIIAVKDQIRAGTVSFQYIAEGRRRSPAVRRSRGRWAAMLLMATAAAAAVALAGRSGGGDARPPEPPAVTIGSPSITIGRP